MQSSSWRSNPRRGGRPLLELPNLPSARCPPYLMKWPSCAPEAAGGSLTPGEIESGERRESSPGRGVGDSSRLDGCVGDKAIPMSRLSSSRWRLPLLLGALVGLLGWVWARDRPSPTHPQGGFGALLLWTALVVSLAGGVIALSRLVRRGARRQPADE